MFRNTYQSGFFSILYSCGSTPLEHWGMQVKNGYIRRVTDDEVKSLALEIAGTNVATTYICCPPDPKKVLGIWLPFLIMIIKNMKKYFTFEITILDDKNMHRRFRVSNFQSTTRVRPFCTSMPIGLSGGWNQIQFNLADFTRRAYGTNYVETTRMQIHANCRIRRIYFADRLYSEDEMPEEFKLFLPIHRKKCVREVVEAKDSKEKEKDLAAKPPAFDAGDEGEEAVPAEEVESEIIPESEGEGEGEIAAPETYEDMQEEADAKVSTEEEEEEEAEEVAGEEEEEDEEEEEEEEEETVAVDREGYEMEGESPPDEEETVAVHEPEASAQFATAEEEEIDANPEELATEYEAQ